MFSQIIPKISFPKKELNFFLLPIFLLIVLFVLLNLTVFLKKDIQENRIKDLSFSFQKPALYPEIDREISKEDLNDISADSYVVLDKDSKVILLSKNQNVRFSMASTVKIMTALTSLSLYKPTDILTVEDDKVEPVVVGFKKGEKITFENILYAMMLPSGNDAAMAIAQNYPSGEKDFIWEMNKRAKNFNLADTHFSDSIGLDDMGDYSTVLDLARLSSIAMENEAFANIVSTKSKVIKNISGKTYFVSNLNKLLGTDGINGIKTGYTEEALGVLATSKIYKDIKGNNHNLIIVVMKSKDRFADTQKILSLISGNLSYFNFNN